MEGIRDWQWRLVNRAFWAMPPPPRKIKESEKIFAK